MCRFNVFQFFVETMHGMRFYLFKKNKLEDSAIQCTRLEKSEEI